MTKYISKTEKDTNRIAANLAQKLKGGEIIALEGELGAGKTTFVQCLAKSCGIAKQVTSPTFVLMKTHQIRNPKSEIRNLIHVDCYRLDDPQELFYLGIEEYLNKPGVIVVIEWADKIKEYLTTFKKIVWIKINLKDNKREFII